MTPYTYAIAQRLMFIQDLGVNYGDKTILRNINVDIHNITRPGMQQGQVVALVGASGVGKTQLFRCIAGLQKPTFGCVKMEIPERHVEAGQVGVVFQSYPLLKHRTVLSNLELAAHHNGSAWTKQQQEQQIDFYLTRFGLADRKSNYPAELSGGQRQRVAIIQQLLCSEHFLLMDEPFSGLDIKMKDEVCHIISEVSLVNELNTIIVTTHDIDTAVKIADHVWVLSYERDAAGNRIPGATVVKQLDLIERGLAWNPDVMMHPNFTPTVREIQQVLLAT